MVRKKCITSTSGSWPLRDHLPMATSKHAYLNPRHSAYMICIPMDILYIYIIYICVYYLFNYIFAILSMYHVVSMCFFYLHGLYSGYVTKY